MSFTLAHAPAKIVRQLLVDRGWAADPNAAVLSSFPAYYDNEPNIPDDCITLYDTSPQIDGRTMPDGEQVQHHGIQVRLRSADPDTGFAKASFLRRMMTEQVKMAGVLLGSTQYVVWVLADLNLLRLGRDTGKTKRSLFTINLMASITAR